MTNHEPIDTTLPRYRETFITCCFCHHPLSFEAGYGWTHSGGGRIALRCPDCGWGGAPRPTLTKCPNCGGGQLRDSHIATPRRS